MKLRVFELTEEQQELLVAVLGTVLLKNVEAIIEEQGKTFEDFAEIYSIMKLGGSEKLAGKKPPPATPIQRTFNKKSGRNG